MNGKLFYQTWSKNILHLKTDVLKNNFGFSRFYLGFLIFTIFVQPLFFNERYNPQEIFFRKYLKNYQNKSFCVITNQSGLGRYLLWPPLNLKNVTRLHEIFLDSQNELKEVFSAEHGLFAQEEEHGNHYMEKFVPKSLYRLKESEVAELLKPCDIVVYDLPDAGVRPYTYRTIATTVMRALSNMDEGKIFYLMDTPNPASHLGIMGPVAQKEKFSILGEEEIPHLPFYTYGELATYYKDKMNLKLNLFVQKLEGYRAGRFFLDQPFLFYPPSPNLPSFRALQCYWMMVFLEGTYVEEGRATKDPFCTFGHPEFDPKDVIPSKGGVYYVPFSFIALSGRYKNKLVHGYRIEIPAPHLYNPVEAAFALLQYLKKRYPKLELLKTYAGKYYSLDELNGTDSFRKAIEQDLPYTEWLSLEAKKIEKFRQEMKKYRLY